MSLLARAAATALLACAPAAQEALPDGAPPNVLVVVADDLAFGLAASLGHPQLETPHFDRLVREGVLLRNAFVTTSLCGPSRASILTGRYARSHGIRGNLKAFDGEQVTIAHRLAAAGYRTGGFGKWHMGDQPGPPSGFETWTGFVRQGRYHDCPFLVGGEERSSEGFVDDVTTGFAIDFLREHRRDHGDRPFLAYVAFKSVHPHPDPAPRFRELYLGEHPWPRPNLDALPPFPLRREWAELAGRAGVPARQWRPRADWAAGRDRTRQIARDGQGHPVPEDLSAHYRMVAGLDDNLGRLLAALDELELTEHTAVFLISDNGLAHGEHGWTEKGTAYEESMRVPFVVRLPAGRGGGGRVVEELALNVDLAPTVCELAGTDLPGAQGRSLLPLLEGREVADWRRDFLYEYFQGPNFLLGDITALRSATHKLITYPGYPTWTELFDLQSDPFETRNLASDPEQASRREAMEARLAELATGLEGHGPGER